MDRACRPSLRHVQPRQVQEASSEQRKSVSAPLVVSKPAANSRAVWQGTLRVVRLAIRTCPWNTEPAAPQTVTEAEDAPPGSGEALSGFRALVALTTPTLTESRQRRSGSGNLTASVWRSSGGMIPRTVTLLPHGRSAMALER